MGHINRIFQILGMVADMGGPNGGLWKELGIDINNSKYQNPQHRKPLPFQNGVVVTVNSFKSLYFDLKSELNIEYLLGSKLNQDYIENWFSTLRALGRAGVSPT